MAKLVGETLQMVRFETRSVVDDVIMSRAYCSLSYRLAHDKEVVPKKKSATYKQTEGTVGANSLEFRRSGLVQLR